MATSRIAAVLGSQGDGVLGTSYGNGTTGFITKTIKVHNIDFVTLLCKMTGGNGSIVLTQKMQISDYDAHLTGWHNSGILTAGALTVDENTIDQSDLEADGTFHLRFDVRGLSKVRFPFKVSATTGTPALNIYCLVEAANGPVVPGFEIDESGLESSSEFSSEQSSESSETSSSSSVVSTDSSSMESSQSSESTSSQSSSESSLSSGSSDSSIASSSSSSESSASSAV